MRATTIQLYSDELRDDQGDPGYCGCWYAPCPDDDPRIADLERLHLGRVSDRNGVAMRCFFFDDEVDEMAVRAERETGCIVAAPFEFEEVAAMRER